MTPGAVPRRSVVIHAHFYQPPREEPWLELVEREPGAAPYHDWNQKIERECYRAMVAARIPAADGRIIKIANTLERISFNVGPTLADWMEREAPDTWAAMLAADRTSRLQLGGHGNALAQPYHHVILPLASRRDKETEVRWGLADFRRRFGREPEGMWLPETAVDDETLDVLAAQGIRFTILAPHQVKEPPPAGLPGLYTTSAGRSIAVFLYHGRLSHDIAFGPLVTDAAKWTAALLEAPLPAQGPALVSIATDGETYGHHHRFGEMALASTLERLGREPDVRVENFAAFLARQPAEHRVRLVERTSWSCAHGVERWRADCGCRVKAGTSQAWRAPLRAALDDLAAALHARFESEAAPFFPDPWAARDAYAAVGLPSHLPVRARELLEMERNALRMFTSCGWFFDDIGGLESIVCLRYAARALELAGSGGEALEAALRERLAPALSNDPALGTGRDVYDRSARPAHPGEVRAAAGYAAVLALAPERVRPVVGAYLVGPAAEGRLEIRHRRTGGCWSFEAAVQRPTPIAVLVELRAEGAPGSRTVTLTELPEHAGDEVRRALRTGLRREVLGEEIEREIADGRLSYRRAVPLALIRQLPADPAGSGSVDPERLARTLDLLALDEQPVPFDAQTRFFRLLAEGPRRHRPALLGLAERFGFIAPDGSA
jgi:uncharacterized protein DUF3536/glycosyl hydrolase family 57